MSSRRASAASSLWSRLPSLGAAAMSSHAAPNAPSLASSRRSCSTRRSARSCTLVSWMSTELRRCSSRSTATASAKSLSLPARPFQVSDCSSMDPFTRPTKCAAVSSRSRMGPTARSSNRAACAASSAAAYRATSSRSTSNASSAEACSATSASCMRDTLRPTVASHAWCSVASPPRQPSMATADMDTGGSSDCSWVTCSVRDAWALCWSSARSRKSPWRAGGFANSSLRMRATNRLMLCSVRRLRQPSSAATHASRSLFSFSTSRTRSRRSSSAMPRRSSMDARLSAMVSSAA
mmetsp:Transcript_30988/g.77092  ORF Transcript_30988/g.77092 Transcript_30988/m.77092 type:complete len:294 (-) Transcript_30988:911-1792(-)